MTKLSKDIEEVVVRKRHKVLGVECDICERLVSPYAYKTDSNRYFKVKTGHHDWGNDSCESITDYDICPNCIVKFMTEYVQQVDGTEYMEMKTKYVYENEYEYE